ncbi:MAG: type II toxin-antitoxin system HicB family antitoxin [Gammaproteobacteria bacterium]|nr:type II toxin-antitoxin system HicB family antitoxin [Gammaproteobacteria bacterium]
MKNTTHQINIKVDEGDLKFIDSKAKRYGLSRSSMIKYMALNAEFNIDMQEQLRKPKV